MDLMKSGLANSTAEDFAQAGFEEPIYQEVQVIADHSVANVDFFTKEVLARGGNPFRKETYAYPSVDAASFIGVAGTVKPIAASG
ncbi:MAG: hypothetical protein Q9164_007682, partial [Protoblastenia rupestris]